MVSFVWFSESWSGSVFFGTTSLKEFMFSLVSVILQDVSKSVFSLCSVILKMCARLYPLFVIESRACEVCYSCCCCVGVTDRYDCSSLPQGSGRVTTSAESVSVACYSLL